MFLTDSEQALSNEYLSQGYVVRPVADLEALLSPDELSTTSLMVYA